MVGIQLHYKFNFVSFCDSTHASIWPVSMLGIIFYQFALLFLLILIDIVDANKACEKSEHVVKFDIIIGSDGSSSNVRKLAEVENPIKETFPIQGESRTVPGIRQVTFIANFDPWKSNNGNCPELEVDSSGEILSPYYPSFFFTGKSFCYVILPIISYFNFFIL